MLDDPLYSMMKTQTFMMSTLAPISTPRRRYHNNANSQLSKRKSVLSKTINLQHTHIAASISKEHRKQLKTPNLPELKKEKQVMLQEWLNHALEGQGDVVTKQPLKAIKKYGLDKANLRNMQLSHESINKLYKGLYVYTSGMKNAFQEMLVEAQSMPRQDNLLAKLYFKAFMKLFENIVPIKSCFQLIQNEYLKSNGELKKTIADLHVLIERQKEEKDIMERKLRKQIEDVQSKIAGMMTDYKIMESTLHLYEESFAQEVGLRLKFQEKINQTYSSYEELKTKYDWIRQQLDQSRQSLAQNMIAHKESADKITSLTVQNKDLHENIKRLEEKMLQRQSELNLKNQQILDIRLMNHSEQQKKLAQEIALSDLLTEIKLQRKQKRQIESKYELKKKQHDQLLKRIQKLKEDLINARERNDDVYMRYHEATLKIIPVQKEIHQKDLSLLSLQKQLAILNAKKQILENDKASNEQLIIQLKTDLENKNRNLNITSNQIEKLSKNIEEMKETKDRYERINEKLQQDLKMIKLQNQTKVNLYAQQKEQNSELKFKVSNLQKKVNELQFIVAAKTKDLQEREQFILNFKRQQQSKEATLQGKLKLKQKQFQAKSNSNRRMMDELGIKESEKYKKLEEISYLRKQNEHLQLQLTQKQNKLEQNASQIQKRNIEIEQLKRQLESRQFTLNKKKSDIDSQILNLKIIISNLKEKSKLKAQYIHPMIQEDLKHQLVRSNEKIENILSQNEQMRSTYDSIRSAYESAQKQLKTKKEEARYGAVEVTALKQTLETSNKQLLIIKQQIRLNQIEFQKKMQERQNEVKKEQHQLKVHKEQINDFIRMKQNQLNLKADKLQKIELELKMLRQTSKQKKQLKVSEKQQQTQPLAAHKIIVQTKSSQVGIQTENLQTSSGKKLTTSDRLRQKKIMPAEEEENNQLRGTQLHQVQQQKQVQRHRWQQYSDRKIDDKQYKAALKFTYMRS